MFGNHVLQLRSRVAVKLNFRPYIQQYTSPNENFEYSYPLILMHLQMQRDVWLDNVINLRQYILRYTVRRIYCRKPDVIM